MDGGRVAGGAQREAVRVLSGAVRRRHVHHPHPTSQSLLRLQPHHPVRPHLQHGSLPVLARPSSFTAAVWYQ